ncbi:MAG: Nramp family divalent metal transporter [Armatimonadota bacterium]
MSTDLNTAAASEKLPDPGELPAWEVGELPAPVPFGWKNVLAAIGPGIIVLGGSIGTGEWLMGPAVTVRFQGAMLWIATLAIFFQSFLNMECVRYALYTGEPIFTGFLRSKPGPKFWAAIYFMCDLGMFFPAFAGALAQLLVAGYLGPDATLGSQHGFAIMATGIGVTVIGFVLMLFGGKIYNTLLACMTFKVLWVLGFLIFIDFFLVGWDHWKLVLQGFFFPFNENGFMMPKDLKFSDWTTIAGFAAFAGAGGLSNATFSNYAREKGWGMGAHVGCIPSAVGGVEVELSPLGKVFRVTDEAMHRWKAWWKYVHFDQYAVWVVGCFAGVILPAAMSIRMLDPEMVKSAKDWEIASMQAKGIMANMSGNPMLFWWLTLFTGFLIIWFTQVQAMDHVTRRWTDILWTASPRAREASGAGGVKKVYYGILLTYACINIAVLIMNQLIGGTPFGIVILTSVTSGFATAVSAIHTFYVNKRFLPKQLQASWWRTAGLLACAVFYLIMTTLAGYGKISSELAKRNAPPAAAAPAVPSGTPANPQAAAIR